MGRERFTRRGATSTLGVAFLVLIVALAGGCGGEEQPTGEPVDEAASPVEEQGEAETMAEEPAEETAASIGEPITVGDAQWTVTDAEPLNQLVSRLGTEEGSFIIVDVTFANNSNQDVALAAPSLALLDSEGREFEVDLESTFTHVEASENMFVRQVEPEATKEGLVIFEVAPDASGFELRVADATNFLSDEHGYVDLGF